MMKVCVFGEYSGVIRDAFAAKGHDAMSCDLLPSERGGQHYQGDMFDVIDYPWDLGIFHPECTHTAPRTLSQMTTNTAKSSALNHKP